MSGLSDGGFIAVWESTAREDGKGIYGERFDSDGNHAGGEIHMNTYETGDQVWARVAGLLYGGFVTIWEE